MSNLERFLIAQSGGAARLPAFQKAYKEISEGAKTTHWIWYIFPQLKALGYSQTARYYGIENVKEACEYLQNAGLYKNYYAITQLVFNQLNHIPLGILMGSEIDAQKLTSSLTLFRHAASSLSKQGTSTNDYNKLVRCCDKIFARLRDQGYFPCKDTLSLINKKPALPNPRRAHLSPVNQAKRVNKSLARPKATVSGTTDDYSALSDALGDYIKTRGKEWSFHYNFLGIMSVIYWLHDVICGTDYFNNKSRNVKVSAATCLKQMIDNKDCESIRLSKAQKIALTNDSLGDLVSRYGGLDKIIATIKTMKIKNLPMNYRSPL